MPARCENEKGSAAEQQRRKQQQQQRKRILQKSGHDLHALNRIINKQVTVSEVLVEENFNVILKRIWLWGVTQGSSSSDKVLAFDTTHNQWSSNEDHAYGRRNASTDHATHHHHHDGASDATTVSSEEDDDDDDPHAARDKKKQKKKEEAKKEKARERERSEERKEAHSSGAAAATASGLSNRKSKKGYYFNEQDINRDYILTQCGIPFAPTEAFALFDTIAEYLSLFELFEEAVYDYNHRLGNPSYAYYEKKRSGSGMVSMKGRPIKRRSLPSPFLRHRSSSHNTNRPNGSQREGSSGGGGDRRRRPFPFAKKERQVDYSCLLVSHFDLFIASDYYFKEKLDPIQTQMVHPVAHEPLAAADAPARKESKAAGEHRSEEVSSTDESVDAEEKGTRIQRVKKKIMALVARAETEEEQAVLTTTAKAAANKMENPKGPHLAHVDENFIRVHATNTAAAAATASNASPSAGDKHPSNNSNTVLLIPKATGNHVKDQKHPLSRDQLERPYCGGEERPLTIPQKQNKKAISFLNEQLEKWKEMQNAMSMNANNEDEEKSQNNYAKFAKQIHIALV
ncbi:hypothetical protein STCU_11639 [Strigomonas culicis]|uniref:Uncharacterized protein n=1 Tax=Strigomonas culicis TaxID=28005 RepID=S9UZI9_9TRYP|nr:hypothetical protein STCU_11639 [Strigomonas culicis]|eukprot:EPY15965.1 hypothetical protein STCU_11639 [Strigomonas culicis]